MGPDLLKTKGYNLICIHVPSGSKFFGCWQHIFVSVHFRGRSALTSFCVCLEITLVCGGRYSSRSESEWVLRGVIFHRNQKRTLKHPPTVSGEQAEVSSLAAAHKGHKLPWYCLCTQPGRSCWNTRPGTHNGWGQGQQYRHFLTEKSNQNVRQGFLGNRYSSH